MTAYDFVTLDVFTDKKFAGNQLAAVMDARGLSTEQMQTITREFNLSETTFVLPPENPDNTARVRIFTLGYEMPFAGHPTVGTAIAVARARGLKGKVRLELNTGVFPVEVDASEEGGFAEFENPNLPAETGAAPGIEDIAAALSLPADAILQGAKAPRLCGAGVDYLYVCAPLEAVRRATPNTAAWAALGLEDVVGVYLYAEGGEAADADYHARMFAPDAGIMEDPATGSAAAGFPGQIVRSQTVPDGVHRWVIEQGFEMGRPSRIRASVAVEGGAVQSVRIGGDAVFMQKGQIFI
ncbi:PhzF family phenazine biosynthesis protein [Hyphococcus luteus]|uniref:Phenazine biosynthesis protein PhzF n=1 Tax=Hyphococcus luteus TaxID=2058213 RepID=A0A2S7K841_9PROT|nr:PhzF family phenazine biosynthesis protein [Marinicaulis flavus]PQA88651.1 phenazine biosynthesis protein PhzF [Marinicaulis flavus]